MLLRLPKSLADQISLRNPQKCSHNVDQSVFLGKANNYQRIDIWQYLPICQVFTNCQDMEYKGVLSFIVIFVTLLALIGVSRFVHQRICTTTQLCVQNHHLTLLRGLLLLFLGPEDLRPSRGTNNSSSLNGTTLPSNLMAGSFHLHSSDNFDAYLSEVISQFIKFVSF